MKNLLKSLIVWLMFVAIPFQGFAAASMLPSAQPPAATMAPEHCATMSEGMHHAANDQSDHSSSHHHASGKCHTCASCCVGAALAPPAPVVRIPGESDALADFHFQHRHVARVDLALPERPPKTLLI